MEGGVYWEVMMACWYMVASIVCDWLDTRYLLLFEIGETCCVLSTRFWLQAVCLLFMTL